MRKVLIISGHPNIDRSLANHTILNELQNESGLMLETRFLDRLYPMCQIDVVAEQAALIEAYIIVWQFPFHWYSLPALLKKWVDDVLVFGFAHGQGGDKLHGKKLILSFTTGAKAEDYSYGKAMNSPVDAFMQPLRQTATLCGMDLQKPIVSNGMMYIPGVSTKADRANVEAKSHNHAHLLIKEIRSLINTNVV